MPPEAIHITPPEPGKSTLVIKLECTNHAKARRLFDQLNGEILDRGEVTLQVTKRRKPLNCLTSPDDD